MMRKKRVLIIDDEPTFTRILKLNLEKSGEYEVLEENAGRRGLTAAIEFKPDLILLDVIMPDIDGGTVASQLKAAPQTKATPILFLTAVLSKSESKSHGGVLSGYPCIAKPAGTSEIASHIDETLKEDRKLIEK